MVVLPVVRVWKVRMFVHQRLMPMYMAVFCAAAYGTLMLVLVVLIMNVFMIVHLCFVGMFVFMMFSQMQPDAYSHQGTGRE